MTKFAELRSLSSPEFELQTGFPDDPENFCVLVSAEIGMRGEIGEDLFRFYVCTPTWLIGAVRGGRHEWSRNFLIVERWDYDAVYSAVRGLVDRQSADDWLNLAERLGRWFDWEYDDNGAHSN